MVKPWEPHEYDAAPEDKTNKARQKFQVQQ